MNFTILKKLAALIVVSFAFGLGWNLSAKYARNVYDKQKAEADKQHAEQLANAVQSARSKEQIYINKLAEIDRAYLEQLKAKNRERVAAVAAAKSRGLYVRASCPSGSVSGTATGTSSGDGTTPVRLSDADAGFLLSLAAEADQIAEQLAACQAIVKTDRE